MIALAVVAVAPGCGLWPKKVTLDDCETWADRVMTVARLESEEGEKRCTVKPTPEDRKELDKETAALRDEVVTHCRDLVGRPYAPRDASCLSTATKAEDLRTCAFATSFFPELVEGAIAARRVADTRCKLATQGAPKPDAILGGPTGGALVDPKKKVETEDLSPLPTPTPSHSASTKPEPSIAKKDPKGKKK